MKKMNSKLARQGKSIAGAAQFVRKQVARGVDKRSIKAAVLKRWPKFETDKAGLESRLRVAQEIVSHAE